MTVGTCRSGMRAICTISIVAISMLRGCVDCKERKPHAWFDLEDRRCNTCSRMTAEWINDETIYPPIVQSCLPEIDWSIILCPVCACRLFAEEVSQFGRITGIWDKYPCCANGEGEYDSMDVDASQPPAAGVGFLPTQTTPNFSSDADLGDVCSEPAAPSIVRTFPELHWNFFHSSVDPLFSEVRIRL